MRAVQAGSKLGPTQDKVMRGALINLQKVLDQLKESSFAFHFLSDTLWGIFLTETETVEEETKRESSIITKE